MKETLYTPFKRTWYGRSRIGIGNRFPRFNTNGTVLARSCSWPLGKGPRAPLPPPEGPGGGRGNEEMERLFLSSTRALNGLGGSRIESEIKIVFSSFQYEWYGHQGPCSWPPGGRGNDEMIMWENAQNEPRFTTVAKTRKDKKKLKPGVRWKLC